MNLKAAYVVYADEDYAVFYKPAGLPSAPLTQGDKNNAVYEASKVYPALMGVVSKYKEIEKGLLHRIDTNTSGLILFAGNQQTYDNIIEQQEKRDFVKYYSALVKEHNILDYDNLGKKGFPPCSYSYDSLPLNIKSSFRKYGPGGKEVRPVCMGNMSYYAKIKSIPAEYDTEIYSIERSLFPEDSSVVKVQCKITKGFRHQVRCHLAWAGLPIIGDTIYGLSNDCISVNGEKNMLFFAHALEFIDPKTNKKVYYSIESSCFESIFFTSESR